MKDSKHYNLPNDWYEIINPINDLAEYKLVFYAMCHLWLPTEDIETYLTPSDFLTGKKRRDGTSIDKGTGVSQDDLQQGLGKAVTDGYLIRRDDGTYVLHMREN